MSSSSFVEIPVTLLFNSGCLLKYRFLKFLPLSVTASHTICLSGCNEIILSTNFSATSGVPFVVLELITSPVFQSRCLFVELTTSWIVQTSEFYKRSNYTKNPKVIHYIGKYKPWLKYSLNYHKEYFVKYLQLTPWRMNKTELFFNKYIENVVSILKYPLKKPFFWLNINFYKAIYKNIFN